MRFALIATFLFGLFASNGYELRAQTEFPYDAEIVGDEGIVRSGPGTAHYGTDRLSPGTLVKVFSHDPGGWMAIRPPEGSFSLLQMNEVEMIADDIARITKNGTMAWVGTRLSAVNKPMFQIRFRKGETVRVIGTVDRDKFELSNEEPDWLQIAPPPGEFRWIAAANLKPTSKNRSGSTRRSSQRSDQNTDDPKIDIGDESGLDSVSSERPNSNNSRSTRPFDDWDDGPSPKGSSNDSSNNRDWSMDIESDAKEGDRSTDFSGWKPARQPISNFVQQRSRFVSDVSPNQQSDLATDGSNNNSPNVPSGFASSGNSSNGTPQSQNDPSRNDPNARSNIFDASGSIQGASQLSPTLHTPNFGNSNTNHASGGNLTMAVGQPVQNLELLLSNEMAKKDPSNWNLMPLAAEAERLRNQANNPNDASRIKHILDKIRNCREIKAGYKATGVDRGNLQTRRNSNQISSNGNGSNTVNGQQNKLLYNYDASGFLVELIRDNGTSPSTFVLKNEQGQITHHVAAPPGLNLRRYLNQRVGIIGNRGYNQKLRLEHVTAERITTVRR